MANETMFDQIAATLHRDAPTRHALNAHQAEVLATLLNSIGFEPFQFPGDYESAENVQRYTALYPYAGEGWGVEYISAERRWSPSLDQRKTYGMYPEREECPEHGLQNVKGYGTTRGADPYGTLRLGCGHVVTCLGPGSPNAIVNG